MENQAEKPLTIPLAIVAAGIIIAGAIFFTFGGKSGTENQAAAPVEAPTPSTISTRPVTEKDHILGSRNAEVIVVEYSDLECPFCKQFQGTMKQVMEKYGPNGKVAWVYRHFPLDAIHPTARKEAEASECAGSLGGEVKFWEFVDELFQMTQSNGTIAPGVLDTVAEKIGLSKKAFEECTSKNTYAQRVEDDSQDALKAGGRGTPYSVILTKNGKTTAIPGAVSFESLKATLEKLLKGGN